MLGRKSARRVHADQPVCLAPCSRRLRQIVELRLFMQGIEAFLDALRRQVGNPQPLYRLRQLQLLLDQSEYVLAFPPGIAGVNDAVAALGHFADRLQLILRSRIRHDLESLGQDRQIAEVPALVFLIVSVRLRQAEQMADRPCDDVVLAFQIRSVIFRSRFDDGSDRSTHVRFLCDYERFHR
ncbi:hypothetical protein D3C77_278750 [compost metagenome]